MRFIFFLNDTTTSTEIKNKEGFDRDVNGEDEPGTIDDQPQNLQSLFLLASLNASVNNNTF